MKIFIAIAAFFITCTMSSQELAKFKWQKRLVVLVSSNWESETVKKQLKLFDKNEEAMEQREMLLMKRSPLSKELKNYTLGKNFEGILLIGKDGGLKSTYNMIIEPLIIFELVDSMPMRQAEMRNKNDQ